MIGILRESNVRETVGGITRLKNGLYQVTTPHLCAGFVVENGRVTSCAPILRKRLNYWLAKAKKVLISGRTPK